ncbi:uncharacterized protein LOC120514340 [Polypterus senegalus]|uniref:uncharacterized protein LOC120514340 n=1 Tax=Polypterus senegalus TaxID=55291 RepID=UPI001964511C|nr:uncharacterized protein LOC120514340 [Polypterus senegalus]
MPLMVCLSRVFGTDQNSRNEVKQAASASLLKEQEQKYFPDTVAMETNQAFSGTTELDEHPDPVDAGSPEGNCILEESQQDHYHTELRKGEKKNSDINKDALNKASHTVVYTPEGHESTTKELTEVTLEEAAFYAELDLDEVQENDSVSSSESASISSAESIYETHPASAAPPLIVQVTETCQPVEDSDCVITAIHIVTEESKMRCDTEKQQPSNTSRRDASKTNLCEVVQSERLAFQVGVTPNSTFLLKNENVFDSHKNIIKAHQHKEGISESDTKNDQRDIGEAHPNPHGPLNDKNENALHVLQVHTSHQDSLVGEQINATDKFSAVLDDHHPTPSKTMRNPCKKIPKDYCVIEESTNANVDTKHVDFQFARKQWLLMEQLTKTQSSNRAGIAPQKGPNLKAFAAKHQPCKSQVEELRRDCKTAAIETSIEHVSLNDQHHIHFSPYSTDCLCFRSQNKESDSPPADLTNLQLNCVHSTGRLYSSLTFSRGAVSPTSCRETPINKEMREALEQEEILRHERTILKSTPMSDYAEFKAKHSNFPQGCGNVRGTHKLVSHHPVMLPNTEEELTLKARALIKCERVKVQETGEIKESARGQNQNCNLQEISTVSAEKTDTIPKAPFYHEISADNVIILEQDTFLKSPRNSMKELMVPQKCEKQREWPPETANVIILETSNLIIRSASEFSINSLSQESCSSTFQSNPFFKLKSRSSLSLVDQEIKIAKQREEELQRQRASLYAQDRSSYSTILVSPNTLDIVSLDKTEIPIRCKSSPSSPMKSSYKTAEQSKVLDMSQWSSAASRWEPGMFSNHRNKCLNAECHGTK